MKNGDDSCRPSCNTVKTMKQNYFSSAVFCNKIPAIDSPKQVKNVLG